MYTSKSSGTARTLKPSRFLASLVETRTFSGKNGNEDSKEKESATKTARKVPQWSLLLAENLSTSNKKKIDDGVKKFEKSVSQGNHSEGHKKQSPKIRWDNRNQYNKNKTAHDRLSAVEQRVKIIETSKKRDDFERGNLTNIIDTINALQDRTRFLEKSSATQAKHINRLEKTADLQGRAITSLIYKPNQTEKQENLKKTDTKEQIPFTQRIKEKDNSSKNKRRK